MKTFVKFFAWIIASVGCSRILIINPTPSYSHQRAIHPVVKGLLKRGHSIVFITTHPIKDTRLTNLTEIDLGIAVHFSNVISSEKASSFNLLFRNLLLFVEISDAYLKHPEITAMIRNESEHFDLVIAEYLSPVMFAFKVRFNCPFIGYLSLDAQNIDHRHFGNSDNPGIYPDSYISDGVVDTFMQRVYNVVLSLMLYVHREYILDPLANKIIRSHFGNNYPDIGIIAEDADMLFVGANLMLSVVRPVTPATVVIGGGIHIEADKELPKDLKTFLDNSKMGTIYISFGSIIQSSKFPPHVIQVFLETIKKLPYDFLWKFEEENLPYELKNLRTMKWVPQQDVLRHKNVKLFITQAGLQSIDEALYGETPMLAIPFLIDQHYNAPKIVEKKIGLMVEDINALTSNKLKDLILEILNNSMYHENVKRLRGIIKDEPMRPIDKVIWWTEYVIRHKGAKHLKGPIVPFYQRYLFDVFLFFMLLLVIVGICMFKLFNFIFYIFKAKKIKVN